MLKNPQVVVRAEPWSIRAWRPVELPSARAHLPWSQFHHMGTKVGDYDDEGRAIGNTMWAAELGDGALVGASWDWVEVRPGVVALRDPNGVLTNLRFIDEDGHLEPELKAICLQNLDSASGSLARGGTPTAFLYLCVRCLSHRLL